MISLSGGALASAHISKIVHDLAHDNMDESWTCVIDCLQECCMPYAAVKTDTLYELLTDRFGVNNKCEFYRECLRKNYCIVGGVTGEVDLDLLKGSEEFHEHIFLHAVDEYHEDPTVALLQLIDKRPDLLVTDAEPVNIDFNANLSNEDAMKLMLLACDLPDEEILVNALTAYSAVKEFDVTGYIHYKIVEGLDINKVTRLLIEKKMCDQFIALDMPCNIDTLRISQSSTASHSFITSLVR